MTPPCQPTAQGQQMTVGHSSLWSHQSSGSGQSSSSYSHGNLTQQPSVVRMGGAPNPVAFGNSSQFLSHSDYAGNSQNQQIRIAPYSDQPGFTSQKNYGQTPVMGSPPLSTCLTLMSMMGAASPMASNRLACKPGSLQYMYNNSQAGLNISNFQNFESQQGHMAH